MTGPPNDSSRERGIQPVGSDPVIGEARCLHGVSKATAFSPIDAMPLVPWAKMAMTVQATISLAVLGLVVARAVNVLT